MKHMRAAEADQNARLAYSIREVAALLGISYISVWRLVQRGKIRCCDALRTKIIPAKEVERFLNAPCA